MPPMRAILVTAPTEYVITRAEAKKQCRVREDYTEEDALIDSYIAAAQAEVESILGRSLTAQTWRLPLDSFPSGSSPILLPRGPVTSVTTFAYTDSAGDSQALTGYVLNSYDLTARIYPPSTGWPATDSDAHPGVSITYECGFGSATIDPSIVQIVRLFVGRNYESREALEVGTIISEYPHVMRFLTGHAYKDWTDYDQ